MSSGRPVRGDFWIALGENLKIAVRALRAHKLRTVLTVLGNVVAVMSVIAVVSIIDGVNTYVSEKILEQGLRVIYIDKFGLITDDDAWREAMKRQDLTLFEAQALQDRMQLAARAVSEDVRGEALAQHHRQRRPRRGPRPALRRGPRRAPVGPPRAAGEAGRFRDQHRRDLHGALPDPDRRHLRRHDRAGRDLA